MICGWCMYNTLVNIVDIEGNIFEINGIVTNKWELKCECNADLAAVSCNFKE